MTRDDQLVAWALAHRAVLTHLVKVVSQYIPDEGTAAMWDSTMLRDSMRPLMVNLDRYTADRLTTLAQQEIDRICVAPSRAVPPSEPPNPSEPPEPPHGVR